MFKWLQKLTKAFHIHKWELVRFTGKYSHYECKKCGERTYKKAFKDGYQTLD